MVDTVIIVLVVNVMAFEILRNIELVEVLIDLDAGKSTVYTTLNVDSISMFRSEVTYC
jgi:hypothetical protein